MRKFFKKIDRFLTAIAYAEAGNFDAVKSLLEQGNQGAKSNAEAALKADGIRSATILDFKLAETAALQKPCSEAKLGALS